MTLDLTLFQHLLEATPDAVLLVGADGVIVHANAAVETVFGHPAADVIGHPIEALVPPAHRAAHVEQRSGFHRGGSQRRMGSGLVVQGLHASGSTISLDVQLAHLQHNGQRVTIAVARNIGHILRLQDELARYAKQLEQSLAESELQRARLQELDAEKNRILGVAAHDLRNPLAALRIFTDLLEDDALGPVSDAYQPLIRRISRSVDYMATLVDQLLDWAAIEAGKLVLHREAVDLVDLVRGALEVERLAAQTQSVLVQSSLDPAIGTVQVDRGKLEQVVHNLVSNAVRHSPQGGEVQVELVRGGDQLVLRVIDHGPGVPADQRDQIFEPFARGHEGDGSDAKRKGVGLGLAIVAQIVAGHGGSTSVEDSPGGGATFVVRLPQDAVDA